MSTVAFVAAVFGVWIFVYGAIAYRDAYRKSGLNRGIRAAMFATIFLLALIGGCRAQKHDPKGDGVPPGPSSRPAVT
jgi:hypothetical protein